MHQDDDGRGSRTTTKTGVAARLASLGLPPAMASSCSSQSPTTSQAPSASQTPCASLTLTGSQTRTTSWAWLSRHGREPWHAPTLRRQSPAAEGRASWPLPSSAFVVAPPGSLRVPCSARPRLPVLAAAGRESRLPSVPESCCRVPSLLSRLPDGRGGHDAWRVHSAARRCVHCPAASCQKRVCMFHGL